MVDSMLTKIERVPLAQLRQFPGNPRRGDVEQIAASLRANGQFAPLVVQLSTSFVLSGNHTLRAAQSIGWDEIDVVYVDVDDARAKKILAAANRTADLGTYDLDALAVLLSDIDDLAGTGYSEADRDALLAPEPDTPDPDPEPKAKNPSWGLVITCDSEDEQLELMQRFLEEGLRVRSLGL